MTNVKSNKESQCDVVGICPRLLKLKSKKKKKNESGGKKRKWYKTLRQIVTCN